MNAGTESTGGACRLAILVVGLCVGLCMSVGGCGQSDSSGSTEVEKGYVSEENVGQYGLDAPQRTALEWWRAVQFANAGLVRGFYSPGARPGLAKVQRELAVAARQFVGLPRFESPHIEGNRATLYLFVSRPDSNASPQALSLNLVRTGGGWRLADDQLLAQSVVRAERAADGRSN